ncbi:hypothetical protein SDC9_118560 [bioreactor metagenome]|uniref:Uncharacterized protein n=1 Tax=bioreactor metagenome TaxID=1076179 RepID=A0A645C1U3_9ZZZZ
MLAEGHAPARIGQRLHRGLAHHGGAAEHAVQTRVGGHFDDGGNAAPFLADQDAECVMELHLAAGVAAVAHLVFQALDVHGVFAPIVAPARHVEAAQRAVVRTQPGDDQVRVAHRRRVKPLVAVEQIFPAAPARCHGLRQRGVGAHVRSALLFRHAHADPDAFLLGNGRVALVVLGGKQLAAKPVPQCRFAPQQGDAGLRHRGRAQRALLYLPVQVKTGGPGAPAALVVGVLER